MKTSLALLLCWCLLASAADRKLPRTVLKSGHIEGLLSEDEEVEIYLGIPYAQPPVGDLRWKPPQPVQPWEGVLPAKTPGSLAMQYHFADWVNTDLSRTSEDCLYLNVWKPAGSDQHNLPVLVNIHGGGFTVGEGAEQRMDGTDMARKGVVVVTMNFRLNIFGFFAHPELSAESPRGTSGNYGLMDQIFALEWVKDNIARFGGDPNRITIAGESSGSQSVLALLVSPLSRELIAGGIASSGGAGHLKPLKDAEDLGKRVAEKGGYTSLEQLRAASTEEIMQLYKTVNPGAFQPIHDGYVFTRPSAEAIYEAGEAAQVPLIIGWNSAELPPEAYLRSPGITKKRFRSVTKKQFGKHHKTVRAMYPHNTEAEVRQSAVDLGALGFVVAGTWQWFELHRQHTQQPVYRYLFSQVPPPPNGVDRSTWVPPIGARHAQEIPYSWGNLPLEQNHTFTEQDYEVSRLMQQFYLNFITTGNPNGDSLPNWPAVQPNNRQPMVMQFDSTTRAQPAKLDARLWRLQELLGEE